MSWGQSKTQSVLAEAEVYLVKAANEQGHEHLTNAMVAACPEGRINAKSLGWFVQRHEGEIANGRRFRRRKANNKSGARISVATTSAAEVDVDRQIEDRSAIAAGVSGFSGVSPNGENREMFG